MRESDTEILERGSAFLMGIAPSVFKQRVRSEFVPLFHLPEKKAGNCLGSHHVSCWVSTS